jgi:hypothetical protein
VTDPGRFAGTHLTPPPFPDDDGTAAPTVTAALAEYAEAAPGTGDAHPVQRALLGTRLLVPVVAVLEEAGEVDGRTVEKESSMATVTIRTPAGKVALPAFTCVDSLNEWDPAARPVAVSAENAAQAALEESADALLIDPAGPSRCVLSGAGLRALAFGRPWVPPADDPVVVATIEGVARAHRAQAAFDAGDDRCDLLVEISIGGAAADFEATARAVSAELADHPVLKDRLERGLAVGFRHGIPGA